MGSDGNCAAAAPKLRDIDHIPCATACLNPNHDAVRALRLPDMLERIDSQGAVAVGNTPAEFGAFIAAETTKYAKIIKQANVKLD